MRALSDRLRRRGDFVAALALLAVHLGLVIHGAASHSAVIDEVVYAPAGYSRLVAGNPDVNPEHPPFLKLLLGASWIGAGPPEVPRISPTAYRETFTTFQEGNAILNADPTRAPGLLLRARLVVAALSLALGLMLFLAARAAVGSAAAVLALALYALDPLVVAHAGLATLDVGVSALVFAAVWMGSRALEGSRWWMFAAAAVLGLALATKVTSIVAVPALLAIAIAPALRGEGWPLVPWRLARVAIIAASAAVVLNIACWPGGLDAWRSAWQLQQDHQDRGDPAYALGAYATGGWWWYFPLAWAIKTPVPILAATMTGVALVGARVRREPALAAQLLCVPAVLFGGAAMSSVCLGVRNLLPATPFLAVAGGAALARLRNIRFGTVAVAATLSWLAVTTLRVHPSELAYANELAGGPSRTWSLLTDSNCDWGQDLPALAQTLRGMRVRRLWLDYFGGGAPASYGIERYRTVRELLTFTPQLRRVDGAARDGRELIAVSATYLVDVYAEDRSAHAWLRARTPIAFPGNSIALYDITDDLEAYVRLGEMATRLGDPVTAAEASIRARELRARR
jgi:hypothetical protein